MSDVSDGLAKAPPWVQELTTALVGGGFQVREERRYDQPFGLYSVLLERQDVAIQIASDRRIEGSPGWGISLMRVEDLGRFPVRSTTPASVRATLAGEQPAQPRGWDDAESAEWLIEHLGDATSFVAKGH